MDDTIAVSIYSHDFSIIDDYNSQETLTNNAGRVKTMQPEGISEKVVDYGKMEPVLRSTVVQALPIKLEELHSAQMKLHESVKIKMKNLRRELRHATSKRNELEHLANSYRDSLKESQDELNALKCSLEIQQARSQSAEQQVLMIESRLKELQEKTDLQVQTNDKGGSSGRTVSSGSQQSDVTQKEKSGSEDDTFTFDNLNLSLIEEDNYNVFRSKLALLEKQFKEVKTENKMLKANLQETTAKLAYAEQERDELRKEQMDELANTQSELSSDDMHETSTSLLSLTQSESEKAKLDEDTTWRKKKRHTFRPGSTNQLTVAALSIQPQNSSELQSAQEEHLIAYLRTVQIRIEKLINDGKKTVDLPAEKLMSLFNDSLEMLQRVTSERDKYSKGFSNALKQIEHLENSYGKLEQKLRHVVQKQQMQEKDMDEKNERMTEMQAKLNQAQQDLESLKVQFNISGENLQRILKQRNNYQAEARNLRLASKPLLEFLQRNSEASNLLKPGELEQLRKALSTEQKKQRQPDSAASTSNQAGASKPVATTSTASSGLRDTGGLPGNEEVHRKYVASSIKPRVTKQ